MVKDRADRQGCLGPFVEGDCPPWTIDRGVRAGVALGHPEIGSRNVMMAGKLLNLQERTNSRLAKWQDL